MTPPHLPYQRLQGLIANFRVEYSSESPTAGAPPPTADSYEWRLVNGLWSLLLALGLFASALVVVRARRWRFLRARLRGFLADYGPPAMVGTVCGSLGPLLPQPYTFQATL